MTASCDSESEATATAYISHAVAMADYGLTMQGSCLKRKTNSMTHKHRNSPEVVGRHCSIIWISTRTKVENTLSYTRPTTIIGKVWLLYVLFWLFLTTTNVENTRPTTVIGEVWLLHLLPSLFNKSLLHDYCTGLFYMALF